MATFNEVAAFKSLLQRKALTGVVLVAPYSVAALTTITGSGGTLTAMTGYKSFGKLTNAGVELPSDAERQEQRGWGDSAPSRIDIVSETSAINFTAMETNKATIDAYYGVDQTNVVASLAAGEITFDKPALPELRDKRVLALFRDINKSNGLDVYFGVHHPRANISQNGAQTLSNTEEGWVYPLTAQALLDDAEGTATRLFWGGPGLDGLLADMGYTRATV